MLRSWIREKLRNYLVHDVYQSYKHVVTLEKMFTLGMNIHYYVMIDKYSQKCKKLYHEYVRSLYPYA